MVLIRRYWARSIVIAGEIEGQGDMGAGFVIWGLDGSVPCSRFHSRARADRTPPWLHPPDGG